ncbi:hypothetical protein [Neptunicella sp. SCSIO 80796]|uniref:hypothetical protein n=1 Tax=Neptunicella plasticusilytica TaxID=3117012 RepID=UPI003A4E13EF
MQIQTTGLSLFDYLSDPDKSNQTLQSLAQKQKQDISGDLSSLTDSISLGQTDNPLQVLESGMGSVSLKTVNNMIAFNLRPVAEDLQQMADRFGITDPVEVKLVEGKWQVQGITTEDSETSPDDEVADTDTEAQSTETSESETESPSEITDPAEEAAAQADKAAREQALQRLQDYLDRNQALQKKLDQLNAMSEFYEFGQTQEFAKQLQEANVPEADVVNFLTSSREYIQGLGSFSLSAGGMELTSRGESDTLIEQAVKKFDLDTGE